jgi:enoyl-CoA hydratase/carnithine racemase
MVELTLADGIAWLTLKRPHVLNALDRTSVRQFAAHLDALRTRDDVRVVITRGEGRAFCAGSDLHDIASLSATEAGAAEHEHAAAFARLDALPQPTIAILHGYVLGGGLGLALYHDFRIAAESAILGLPEVELGWTPPWAIGRLMDVAGSANARWLALTCARVSAAEAYALGVVNQVVADAQLTRVVETLARKLIAIPSLALSETKALLNAMSPLRQPGWDVRAGEAFERCYATPDAQESVAAFVARRKT